MKIDRRDFFKGAGALGGLMSFTGLAGVAGAVADPPAAHAAEPVTKRFAKPGNEVEINWSWNTPPAVPTEDDVVEVVDCDILIVGAGIAGSPAAMLAAEEGANVHIIEKVGTWGNHRWCTAGFNSNLQRKAGIEFDRTKFIKDVWPMTNGFQGRIGLYGKWFDNSPDYINWLEDIMKREYGVTMTPMYPTAVTPGSFWDDYGISIVFGNFPFENINWMNLMVDYAQKNGATYHFNTPGEQLIIDEATGRCTGVYAINDEGHYVRFNASKGVLLAAGDFFHDREMVQCYGNVLLGCLRDDSEEKNTGDMHKAAIWVGADMDVNVPGDCFPFHTVTNRVDMRPKPEEDEYYRASQYGNWRPAFTSLPVLVTDNAGHRLAPESGMPFQAMSQVTLSSPQNTIWSIWNDNVLANLPEGYEERNNFTLNTVDQMNKEIENGVTIKANSLDELIELCNFDEETFKKTIERYNELCDGGEDLDCLKDPAWMIDLKEPPYYAAQTCVAITGTRGGLKIDDRMRVLKTDGKPIEGLYACGNNAGSFYGSVYPPTTAGSGVGHGQTFAWIAVKDMLGLEYK